MKRSSSRIPGLSKVTILFTRREDAMNNMNGTKNKTSWTGCSLLGIIGSIHHDESKVIIPLGSHRACMRALRSFLIVIVCWGIWGKTKNPTAKKNGNHTIASLRPRGIFPNGDSNWLNRPSSLFIPFITNETPVSNPFLNLSSSFLNWIIISTTLIGFSGRGLMVWVNSSMLVLGA